MATPREAGPSTPGKAWWRFRVLLVGLVLCRGLVLLCVMPPFEGWDEYQHVGYVVHVGETGRRAVLNETVVPPALVTAAVQFPQPKSALEQIGRLGAVDYATFWARRDPPVRNEGDVALYQAQHAPFYYRMAAPLFRALGGVADLRTSVGGLRLVNLLLTAAAVAVVLGAVGRVVLRPRDAALIGLVIASQPLLLMNGVRVASDALGVLLAAVAVSWGLRLDGRRLLVGSAGLGLVDRPGDPGQGGELRPRPVRRLLPAARRGPRPPLAPTHGAGRALARAGGRGGDPVRVADQPREVRRADSHARGGRQPLAGRTAGDLLGVAAAMDWSKVVRRLWLRDSFFAGGWSFLGTDVRLVKLYYFAGLAGLAGWGWRVVARGRRESAVFESARAPAACLVLCAGFTAALAYHMVQSKLAWGSPTTTPWYACPALPWFLMLVAGGGLAWPIGRFRAAVPVLLTVSCLAGESFAVWARMVPTYSGGASGFEALRRLAHLQPTAFGTATLLIASIGSWVMLAAAAVVLCAADDRSVPRRDADASPSRPAPHRARSSNAPAHPADVPGSPR